MRDERCCDRHHYTCCATFDDYPPTQCCSECPCSPMRDQEGLYARPASDADQLRAAADYMDIADKAVALIAERLGEKNPISGSEMQDDLRRIADGLDGVVRLRAAVDAVTKLCDEVEQMIRETANDPWCPDETPERTEQRNRARLSRPPIGPLVRVADVRAALAVSPPADSLSLKPNTENNREAHA